MFAQTTLEVAQVDLKINLVILNHYISSDMTKRVWIFMAIFALWANNIIYLYIENMHWIEATVRDFFKNVKLPWKIDGVSDSKVKPTLGSFVHLFLTFETVIMKKCLVLSFLVIEV